VLSRPFYIQYFEQKLQTMVLPGNNNQINKGIIVWEEIFQNGITLRSALAYAPESLLP